MFSARKTIFAGKTNLQPEPFCPYISDSNGYISLYRSLPDPAYNWSRAPQKPRPSLRDGK